MIRYAYKREPVDWWDILPGYRTLTIGGTIEWLEQTIQTHIVRDGSEEYVSELITAQLEILKDRDFIIRFFKERGESFRGEDAVIPVVNECELLRAYLVKADENGTTYLFSPVAMDKAPGEEVIYGDPSKV